MRTPIWQRCTRPPRRAGEDADAMRALLAQGADVDAMDLSNLTPLQNAAWGGSAACVRLLLAHGWTVRWLGISSPHLCTLLVWADTRSR